MINTIFNILVVDDEQDYCDVLKMILQSKGYQVTTCNSGSEALELMGKSDYDLVVTDLMMPGMNGDVLMQYIKRKGIPVEVIIMTAYGTIEKAVQAMKDGAYTYITKGTDPEELILEIARLSEEKRLKMDNSLLRDMISSRGYMLDSRSPKFRQVLALAERAAKSEASILILGESGTGKEVLASHIHDLSNRKDNNFLELNCQALSESILESELFGHEKGSFTGAAQRRIGLFEAANHGTLFLDEIGGISMNLQGKLLKAIENKQIYRLGSNVPIDVDFRLITATNRNLHKDMQEEQFRSDLFYRISTIVLELPPLNQRREDIPLFIDYFLKKYEIETAKPVVSMSEGVKEFLHNYNYPGNIRELKNIIERLVVLSDNGYISEECLPPDIMNAASKAEIAVQEESGISSKDLSLKELRSDIEKKYIVNLMQKYPNNLDKVAEVLAITRRQLFNKLVEYGLK